MLKPITHPRPVLFSYGMGRDSSAILYKWLTDPSSRDFELDALTVMTAMTGDEFNDVKRLVELFILPLLRQNGVRFIQIARASGRKEDGVVILDDSTEPTTLRLEGCYPLSAEMLSGGTLPESASGKRKCSIKSKGLPLDTVAAQLLSGSLIKGRLANCRPYRHVIGFNADELRRVDRDQCYGGGGREAEYPLVAWGWGHEKVFDFCKSFAGEEWPKSCCTFCPFSRGKEEIQARWRAFPETGADVLFMERLALALNPRLPLYSTKSAHQVIRQAPGMQQVLEAYDRRLKTCQWACYRVRRCRVGKNWDRSVEKLVTGSQDQALSELTKMASGIEVETSVEGIQRAWVRRRRNVKDMSDAEEMYVVAPAAAKDKAKSWFEKNWRKALCVIGA